MSEPATERYVRSRMIAATPAAIFAVLTDPARHPALQPGDEDELGRRPPTVVSAADGTRINAVGDVFAMHMCVPVWDRRYVVHNRIAVFEPDEALEWWPGGLDDSGTFEASGWWWRYDLEPDGDRTRVTISYDWTGASSEFREMVGGLPVFGPEFLDAGLAALERAVSRSI